MIRSAGAPGSQASLREANSARILEGVRLYGQITQAELAAATGLSAATVSNIVRQLTESGLLQTSATIRSGRRAVLVQLARSAVGVGIHVEQRSMRIELADSSLRELGKQRLALPPKHSFDTTLDRAALLVAELTEAVGASTSELVGIGIAMPSGHRRGRPPVELEAWHDIDVADVLTRRTGRPVIVQREVDAAAVAEARKGALRGIELGLYVRVGESTDSSIVLGGNVMRAETEIAGGLGHVQVDAAGAICICGARGCLNTVVSIDAMRDLLRRSHGSMNLRSIIAAANSGDPGCRQMIADAGRLIGVAIADLATCLGPERIVVGGPLMEVGDVLFEPIRDSLRSRPILPSMATALTPTQLIDSPETLGMVALVHDATGLTTAMEG